MRLRPQVVAMLADHGLRPGPQDTPHTLRERLNDLYLDEVRALRERQQRGEIPLRDYARHVDALRQRFPLLSLPAPLWVDEE